MRRIVAIMVRSSLLCLLASLQSFKISAQSNRTQYPGFLTNHTYFDVSVGYINYAFTNSHVAAGYKAESIGIPHVGVRLILYGYRFNNHLSVQASYLRPVLWVRFNNVNGDQENHPVVMNITGLTLKTSLVSGKNLAMSAEGGVVHVTRTGFEKNHQRICSKQQRCKNFKNCKAKFRRNQSASRSAK